LKTVAENEAQNYIAFLWTMKCLKMQYDGSLWKMPETVIRFFIGKAPKTALKFEGLENRH
jgi:hypothetical protein